MQLRDTLFMIETVRMLFGGAVVCANIDFDFCGNDIHVNISTNLRWQSYERWRCHGWCCRWKEVKDRE